MNYRNEYIAWAKNALSINDTTKQQYVTSIEILSKIIGYDIFGEPNIDKINELYEDLLKNQKTLRGKYYEEERPSKSLKGWYSASVKTYFDFLKERNNSNILERNSTLISFNAKDFINNLHDSGLYFQKLISTRLIASLSTKPFLILTGLSGSGKTKIAQAFTTWICQSDDQFKIIPVGADWTNREPLLGYPNALNSEEYVLPENGALDLIIEATENPDLPYFLILDEMNLSHVERYFADFLSAMESGEKIPLHKEDKSINGVPSSIRIPKNLFIIGTVNIDETTHMFSPKVLDRANTIEFRITPSEMNDFLDNIQEIKMEELISKGSGMAKSFLEMSQDKSFATVGIEAIKIELNKFFVELKEAGAEFGYRSAIEILRLINQLSRIDSELTINQKLDIAIMQKLLPKLHGSRRKLVPILTALANLCLTNPVKIDKEGTSIDNLVFDSKELSYPISHEKLSRMYRGAIENGFTSFAEA